MSRTKVTLKEMINESIIITKGVIFNKEKFISLLDQTTEKLVLRKQFDVVNIINPEDISSEFIIEKDKTFYIVEEGLLKPIKSLTNHLVLKIMAIGKRNSQRNGTDPSAETKVILKRLGIKYKDYKVVQDRIIRKHLKKSLA